LLKNDMVELERDAKREFIKCQNWTWNSQIGNCRTLDHFQ